MNRWIQAAAVSVGLALVLAVSWTPARAQAPVQSYVPESGFYWNSDQPGRGYAIEIQDRLVFMTIYTYTETGNPSLREPLWYSAIGTLSSFGSGTSLEYEFNDELFFSEDGQCLGCDFIDPITTGTNRPIRLTFFTETTAELVIDGEVIPIQRFWYSESINDAYLALQGQWMIITDCTAPVNNNCYVQSIGLQPFEGDLLTLDVTTGSGSDRATEGLREGSNIEVAAAFDSTNNIFVIVVAETDNEFLAYCFFGEDFGTDQFQGIAERYRPGDNLRGVGFPTFGKRLSDRSFAETLSPQKNRAESKAELGHGRMMLPRTQVNEEAEATLKGARLSAANALLRRLENTLR